MVDLAGINFSDFVIQTINNNIHIAMKFIVLNTNLVLNLAKFGQFAKIAKLSIYPLKICIEQCL